MLAIIFLVIGIFSRVITHAPNFTPVIALALFGGMMLEKRQALWMPAALMIISDLIIGMQIGCRYESHSAVNRVGQWLLSRNCEPICL